MRFENSVRQALAAFPDGTFDLKKWEAYAGAIHPELADKCEADVGDYDFENEVRPVIEQSLRNQKRAETLSDTFESVIGTLKERLPVLFDKEPDLDIILYLGLCSGAGWAAILGGRDAVLLGMEKILELGWDNEEELRTLIYHEVGHIWHKTYGCMAFPAQSQREQSLRQLYQEGVAMVCEQILCQDDAYYHQDKDGWLAWCMEKEPSLKAEFLRRLRAGESTQDFFGDWCSYDGHADVGYFLGCRFVRFLLKTYSLGEAASLAYDALWPAFETFAEVNGGSKI